MKQKENPIGNRAKLNMALMGLVTALVMVGMASYAWFTLSTNPEIKGMNFSVTGDLAIQVSTDGENFSISTPLFEEDTPEYGGLIPVSTVDGLNWFVCKYDTDGNVLQRPDSTYGNQFLYLRFPKGGNIPVTEPVGEEGVAPEEKKNHTYYIYKDIYLKTQEEEADVYLSIPANAGSYQPDSEEKNHYGSYVMSYHQKDNQLTLIEGGSETSARIGLMVIGKKTDEQYAEPENSVVSTSTEYPFYIYEPNADRRSEADKSSDIYDADKYIAGFEAKNFRFASQNGKYIQTFPVAPNDATKNLITTELAKDGANENIVNQNMDRWADGTISIFDSSKLAVQLAGTWKRQAETPTEPPTDPPTDPSTDPSTDPPTDPTVNLLEETPTEPPVENPTEPPINIRNFDSTWISSMGKFLNAQALYQGISTLQKTNADYQLKDVSTIEQSLRSSAKITTLKKNEVQKIRVYFWLEGQDVDCWNDIADTDFLVNLEFVGNVTK